MHLFTFTVIALILIAFLVSISNGVAAATGLVVAVLLCIIILKRNQDLSKSGSKIPKDALIITNVDRGGVFKLANVEGYDQDLTLKVNHKHLYQEGDYYWYELECTDDNGEKMWVTVDDDDDLNVSIVIKKLSASDLTRALPANLETYDENESGSIKYLRESFQYKDSGSATYYKFCDSEKAEKLYYWDFVSGNFEISIERWGENEYQYFYSQIIKPRAITVYSLKSEA